MYFDVTVFTCRTSGNSAFPKYFSILNSELQDCSLNCLTHPRTITVYYTKHSPIKVLSDILNHSFWEAYVSILLVPLF